MNLEEFKKYIQKQTEKPTEGDNAKNDCPVILDPFRDKKPDKAQE